MSQRASYALVAGCLIMAGILAALTAGGACGATDAGERGNSCLASLALASPIVETHIYLGYITRFSPISPLLQPAVYLPCILRFSSR